MSDDLSIADQLFADTPNFDFFQSIRLLERLFPEKRPIGGDARPADEIVRIRSQLSLSFPPSSLESLQRPTEERPWFVIVQTFMGLTGPSGVLPRHYTQLLLELERDERGPERRALSDWLALFDHRLVSLFYRAWEKYRFYRAFERGEALQSSPDAFTKALFSLIGMGTLGFRERLQIRVSEPSPKTREVLARIDDFALLYYAGLLTKQTRSVHGLELILCGYFQIPITVQMFQGQWLHLEASDCTCLGVTGRLGLDTTAGDRVWEVSSRFRLRVGPLSRLQFDEFLPDRSPRRERKTLELLGHLTRLYAGSEYDFDVQLVLRAGDVYPTCLGSEQIESRLGWNTWLVLNSPTQDKDDAVFSPSEIFVIERSRQDTNSDREIGDPNEIGV